MTQIILPWPPAILSGHAKGKSWFKRADETKRQREFAKLATLAANVPPMPLSGIIKVHIRFEPPDMRGDKQNFPNRIKAALDGVADGLGVNDKRFLPSYTFGPVFKGGRVIVTVEAV